jgi:hypothetical protein
MVRKTSKREVAAVGIAEEQLYLLGRTAWEIDRATFKLQETVAESPEVTAPASGRTRLGSQRPLKAAKAGGNGSTE